MWPSGHRHLLLEPRPRGRAEGREQWAAGTADSFPCASAVHLTLAKPHQLTVGATTVKFAIQELKSALRPCAKLRSCL